MPGRGARCTAGGPATSFAKFTNVDLYGSGITGAHGGSGLSVTEASVIMEEINRAGGNSGACHGQMYVMGCVLRHGSEEQKKRILPGIAAGKLRMQSMAVTEPTTGSADST